MPTPSEPAQVSQPSAGPSCAVTPERAQDDALARAFLWDHLALGLQTPTPATRERLTADPSRRMLTAAADRLGAQNDLLGLAAAAARLATHPIGSLEEQRSRYDALFGHTARGPVCCFETEYGTEGLFRQTQELAHIGGYYAAFGLRPRAVIADRADHVACECEYVGFLSRKEAFQLSEAGADEDQLQTTRGAYVSFFRDHLGRFGTAVGTRLKIADPEGFFGALASLLLALLDTEARRLGVPLGPATLDLCAPEEDSTPMACGTCDVAGLAPSGDAGR